MRKFPTNPKFLYDSTASQKKSLVAAGKLDKYGRPNENTPAEWLTGYVDYGALANGAAVKTEPTDAAATKKADKVSEPCHSFFDCIFDWIEDLRMKPNIYMF